MKYERICRKTPAPQTRRTTSRKTPRISRSPTARERNRKTSEISPVPSDHFHSQKHQQGPTTNVGPHHAITHATAINRRNHRDLARSAGAVFGAVRYRAGPG